jgi:hypothetical protein
LINYTFSGYDTSDLLPSIRPNFLLSTTSQSCHSIMNPYSLG